ncbi:MAG TPA: hypothetical protein VFW94_13680 [Candidatus Acidoferrales bacterium]|nr:hypothetical protein [Candidatus Acidoferrales bacterium]
MIRTIVILLLAIAPTCSANSKYTETRSQTWQFSGGRVELRVKAGDIHILPATKPHQLAIRYILGSNEADFASKVKTDFEVNSSSAELRIHSPNHGSTDVYLEVPRGTDLYIREVAGDITIAGIEGNEDVQSFAGDIHIDLPPAATFYRADASTRVGDIEDSPFGKPNGWIGKNVHFRGRGEYRLYAHVFAGDIVFSTLTAAR